MHWVLYLMEDYLGQITASIYRKRSGRGKGGQSYSSFMLCHVFLFPITARVRHSILTCPVVGREYVPKVIMSFAVLANTTISVFKCEDLQNDRKINSWWINSVLEDRNRKGELMMMQMHVCSSQELLMDCLITVSWTRLKLTEVWWDLWKLPDKLPHLATKHGNRDLHKWQSHAGS